MARARATALEEKARTNPDDATRLTALARKLRVGAAILERRGRPAHRESTVAPR